MKGSWHIRGGVAVLISVLVSGVVGCTPRHQEPGVEETPLAVTDVSPDVVVELTGSKVNDSFIGAEYRVINNSGSDIWVLTGNPIILPGPSTDAVLAIVFHPIEGDAAPPTSEVVPSSPEAQTEEQFGLTRPLFGEEGSGLSTQDNVRLCVGYVRSEDAPEGQPSRTSFEDAWLLEDAVGMLVQRFACSEPMSLSQHE